jgi:hypothetical protein
MLKNISIALIAMSCLAFIGCKFNRDPAYEAYKCAKVANYIGDKLGSKAAILSFAREMEKSGTTAGNSARISMEMNDRFQEDLQLYKYSPAGQFNVIAAEHSSKTCINFYNQKDTLE